MSESAGQFNVDSGALRFYVAVFSDSSAMWDIVIVFFLVQKVEISITTR